MQLGTADAQLVLRFVIFLLLFTALASWETYKPARRWLEARRHRWLRHFTLGAISKIVVRLVFPGLLIGVAWMAQHKAMGLFHHPNLPIWLRYPIVQIGLSLVVLDLFMYIQHRLLHRYQWLWRLHRAHHMDRELDVSTGLRFHPLEEIFTMAIKSLAVAFLGVPPLGVFIFEVWLNFATLFTHLNVPFRFKTEMMLRRVIVMPGMHRIHHSDYTRETNSNYGFIFSWWDKFFDSYNMVATSGERKLVFGLDEYREPRLQTVWNLLLNPFNLRRLKPKVQKRRATKMQFLSD